MKEKKKKHTNLVIRHSFKLQTLDSTLATFA